MEWAGLQGPSQSGILQNSRKTGEDAALIPIPTSAQSLSPRSIPALRAAGKPLSPRPFPRFCPMPAEAGCCCPWHCQAAPAPACLQSSFYGRGDGITSLPGSSRLPFRLGRQGCTGGPCPAVCPSEKTQTKPSGRLEEEKQFLVRCLVKKTGIRFSRVWPAAREALPSRGLKQQLPTIPS